MFRYILWAGLIYRNTQVGIEGRWVSAEAFASTLSWSCLQLCREYFKYFILSVFKSTSVFHGMAPSYLISEFKRFAHLEKFNLNFSGSSFAIRVNLLHP